jgi:Tol biopolymer transport system component
LRTGLLRLAILALVLSAGVAIGRWSRGGPPGPLTGADGSPVGLAEARARTAAVAPLEPELLAVSLDYTGNYEVYVIRPDGTEPRRLTLDFTVESTWPRISPDRRRILFYRAPRDAPPQDYSVATLWVMNADGTDQRVLLPPRAHGWALHGHAEWSPDGTQLMMFGGPATNTQIHITDDEGRNPRSITSRPGMNIDPSWSPDGKTTLFVGCAAAICFARDWEVFSAPVGGGEARQLTSNRIRDHDPYFSPDGRQIAWIAETEPDAFKPGYGIWSILIMNPDGSQQRNLTNDRAINSVPTWSPDGMTLYFNRYEVDKARWGVYRINLDGRGLVEIPVALPPPPSAAAVTREITLRSTHSR